MNIKIFISVIVLTSSLGLMTSAATAQPGNGNGNGWGKGGNGTLSRWVDLLPTANAPREDSVGRVWIASNPTGLSFDSVMFTLDVSRLTCRGTTFLLEERDTAPFEVYLFKINGEPIYTFNTQCRWPSSLDGSGGDFRSGVTIAGSESFVGWLENPATDPIHAEVYLESPMSDPPTSTLVLEGWLVE